MLPMSYPYTLLVYLMNLIYRLMIVESMSFSLKLVSPT